MDYLKVLEEANRNSTKQRTVFNKSNPNGVRGGNGQRGPGDDAVRMFLYKKKREEEQQMQDNERRKQKLLLLRAQNTKSSKAAKMMATRTKDNNFSKIVVSAEEAEEKRKINAKIDRDGIYDPVERMKQRIDLETEQATAPKKRKRKRHEAGDPQDDDHHPLNRLLPPPQPKPQLKPQPKVQRPALPVRENNQGPVTKRKAPPPPTVDFRELMRLAEEKKKAMPKKTLAQEIEEELLSKNSIKKKDPPSRPMPGDKRKAEDVVPKASVEKRRMEDATPKTSAKATNGRNAEVSKAKQPKGRDSESFAPTVRKNERNQVPSSGRDRSDLAKRPTGQDNFAKPNNRPVKSMNSAAGSTNGKLKNQPVIKSRDYGEYEPSNARGNEVFDDIRNRMNSLKQQQTRRPCDSIPQQRQKSQAMNRQERPVRVEGRQNFRQDGRQIFKEDVRQNFREDSRPNFKEDNRQKRPIQSSLNRKNVQQVEEYSPPGRTGAYDYVPTKTREREEYSPPSKFKKQSCDYIPTPKKNLREEYVPTRRMTNEPMKKPAKYDYVPTKKAPVREEYVPTPKQSRDSLASGQRGPANAVQKRRFLEEYSSDPEEEYESRPGPSKMAANSHRSNNVRDEQRVPQVNRNISNDRDRKSVQVNRNAVSGAPKRPVTGREMARARPILPPIGQFYRRGMYESYNTQYESEEEELDDDMADFIDDGDNLEEQRADVSAYIKEIFGYDRSRYCLDDDDDIEESSFAEQMNEEMRSAKIGLLEDLEDMRQEEEEKRRKKTKKK